MPLNLVDYRNVVRHFRERSLGNLGSKTESLLPVSCDFSTQFRLVVKVINAHVVKAVLEEEPKLKSKNLHFAR